MNRRRFPAGGGVAAIAGVAASCGNPRSRLLDHNDAWDDVRAQFNLARDQINVSALHGSHPKPVRQAIERHRAALDENPTFYRREQLNTHEKEVLEAVDVVLQEIRSFE